MEGLRSFGAPLLDLVVQDLTEPGLIFQIGLPPVRIDVITSIDGVDFDEAWPARLQTVYGGVTTSVLSRRHLIVNKQACGRPQDLADLDWLRSHTKD
jgi:hypothetical protein